MIEKKETNPINTELFASFVEKVKQTNQIWLLQSNEGFYAMFEDAENRSFIPVWDNKEAAKAMATDDWADYAPDEMGIPEFVEWMDELTEDQIIIGVFADSKATESLAVYPNQMKKVLKK